MPPRRAWVPIYGHYPQARLIARGRVRGNAGRRRRGGNGRRFARPDTTGLACVRIVANGWQGSRETPAGSALRAKRWRDGLAPLPPAVGAYPEFLRAPNFAGLPALRIHLRAPDRRRPHLRKSEAGDTRFAFLRIPSPPTKAGRAEGYNLYGYFSQGICLVSSRVRSGMTLAQSVQPSAALMASARSVFSHGKKSPSGSRPKWP